MKRLLEMWRSVSIVKKLYFVVGLMACLIACELVALRFSMRHLSAARAFVGGESLWSKAQKNAVLSLQQFGLTRNEKDYQAFLNHFEIPKGYHRARIELERPFPDMNYVRQNFLAGRLHPDDIGPVTDLLRNFNWVTYLAQAIEIWVQGDQLLVELEEAGGEYHNAVLANETKQARALMARVEEINAELTVLEEEFSYVLGQGSRWLENLVLSILMVAVLTVEGVGLTLAYLISRELSLGLGELAGVAQRIGHGDFTATAAIRSRDEIGGLGEAVNHMGEMLKDSYRILEKRVQERTAEAQAAVASRDEFLSIVSHELKNPLISLHLRLRRLSGEMSMQTPPPDIASLAESVNLSLRQAQKISELLNDLLDLTRVRIGKFQIFRDRCDLAAIAREVIQQTSSEIGSTQYTLTLSGQNQLIGSFDETRIRQIITNLLSNAMKFGNGKPIEVTVMQEGEFAILRVRDQGKGIAEDVKPHLFERFQRGDSEPYTPGLGLGLYIANQIAKSHNGSIDVESKLGQGSIFTVKLPLAA